MNKRVLLIILGLLAIAGLCWIGEMDQRAKRQRIERLERKVEGLIEAQRDLLKFVGETQRSDSSIMARIVLQQMTQGGQSLEEVKKSLDPEAARQLEELLKEK